MGELAYDAGGAGEPALLFLHGWCGDRSFFAPQFDYFSPSHRVVSVDLPGHGESAVPEEYSIGALASRVAELAGDLRLSRSVVFGHSIGAMVALELSQFASDLVRRSGADRSAAAEQGSVERIRTATHFLVLGSRWANRTPSVRRADVLADRRCGASSQDHRDHDRRAQ